MDRIHKIWCTIVGHKWIYKNDWLNARYGGTGNASRRICARCHKKQYKFAENISIHYWEVKIISLEHDHV